VLVARALDTATHHQRTVPWRGPRYRCAPGRQRQRQSHRSENCALVGPLASTGVQSRRIGGQWEDGGCRRDGFL